MSTEQRLGAGAEVGLNVAGRRCAEWRFPSAKQQKAEDTARLMRQAAAPATTRTDEDCWWDAVLRDPRAETTRPSPARTLGEIRSSELRVECLRCFRIVEVVRADAVRLHGADARWRDVGGRLLADGCQSRTGNHEADGCWPDFR
jgi:hypothetical protein